MLATRNVVNIFILICSLICVSTVTAANLLPTVSITSPSNGSVFAPPALIVIKAEALNIILRNNICSQNLSFQIVKESNVPSANLVADHNLIDGFRNYPGEITGSSYVTGNPLFVNSSAADFHLQSNSPAIDSASSLNAPAQDYDSISRPQGAGFDIGAFEFGNALTDYAISCSPASIAVLQGGSVNINCTLTSMNGFSGPRDAYLHRFACGRNLLILSQPCERACGWSDCEYTDCYGFFRCCGGQLFISGCEFIGKPLA
jgi:hypothetical protein